MIGKRSRSTWALLIVIGVLSGTCSAVRFRSTSLFKISLFMWYDHITFPNEEIFVNHTTTFPKLYWPSLERVLHEELRQRKPPIKPTQPPNLGCLGFLSEEYYPHKRSMKEYNSNLHKYYRELERIKGEREFLNIELSNPSLIFPESRKKYLDRIIEKAYKADLIQYSQKGATENTFTLWLARYFSGKVFKNKTVNHFQTHPYVPDFIFYDENTNLHIDIEIDEPYSLTTGEPTHYDFVSRVNNDWELVNTDDFRNSSFAYDGWFTIRFCEEQVLNNPQGCCKVISNLLSSLFINWSYRIEFFKIDNLKPIDSWSILDCIEMGNNRFREKYLKCKIDRPDFNIDMDTMILIRNYREYLKNKT